MKNQSTYQIVIIALIIIPLCLMAWKVNQGYLNQKQFLPESIYDVKFNFMTQGEKENIFVRCFIPEDNLHQEISNIGVFSEGFDFEKNSSKEGTLAEWTNDKPNPTEQISYAFQYQGKKLRYKIDPKIKLDHMIPDSILAFTIPSEHIQSEHSEIVQKVVEITQINPYLFYNIEQIYQYTHSLKKTETSELTTALAALRQQEASCNGKSRLFVAMCRAKGIPARVAGGIILQTGQKKTSHLWAEVWVDGHWIPFDALNGHFASLPSNYLELYKGDYFLINRSTDIEFDYLFDIQKQEIFSPIAKSSLTLWALPLQANIPMSLLKVILLLPFCAMMIALFRNVIGMKTFGIFLPAIITISIDGIGMGFGITLYLSVVAVVGLLHYPLSKWGLLYTPKLVIMLIGVVTTLLGLTYLGIIYQSIALSSIIFFPIIILSIAAEKFAKTIMDEGIQDALKIQGQTLIIVILCYAVYQADFLAGFFLTFPETLAIITSIMLLLGRWIGLRLSEYKRFSWIVS